MCRLPASDAAASDPPSTVAISQSGAVRPTGNPPSRRIGPIAASRSSIRARRPACVRISAISANASHSTNANMSATTVHPTRLIATPP
jgi:hypothetical protein